MTEPFVPAGVPVVFHLWNSGTLLPIINVKYCEIINYASIDTVFRCSTLEHLMAINFVFWLKLFSKSGISSPVGLIRILLYSFLQAKVMNSVQRFVECIAIQDLWRCNKTLKKL